MSASTRLNRLFRLTHHLPFIPSLPRPIHKNNLTSVGGVAKPFYGLLTPALRPTTHRTHIFPLNPLTRRSGRFPPRPRSLIVHLQATIIYPLAICPIHYSLLRPLSIHTHPAPTCCPLNVITPGLLLSIPVILTRLTSHRPPTI